MAFGDGASGSTVGTVGAGSENPMAAGGTAGWCWCGGGDDGGEKHRQRSVEVLCSSLLGPRCNISARPSCWEEAQLGAAPCAGGSPRARKQVRSLPKPPTPTVEEERCVVWVSIDPRSGSISAYPSDCANRVEEAYQQGLKSVPLKGFGGFYESACIELLKTRSGRPEQHSSHSNRRRDVRRFELPRGAHELLLHAVHEGGWRFSDEAVEGRRTERRLELLGFEKAPLAGHGGSCGAGASAVVDISMRERMRTLDEGDATGQVGLWEWCRLPRADRVEEVPDKQWGLYDEASSAAIEVAFRSQKTSVKVVVGIRTFEIVFDGPTLARQVDHALRKGRHVRRRLLPAADRERLFLKAACDAQAASGMPQGSADEECAICCNAFSETPLVHSVRLPECGHWFHRPCIQDSADKKAGCPLCRAEIDWVVALDSVGAMTVDGSRPVAAMAR
mmetsp:Transcript_128021/g.410206  ORF Transcript_128021/g.410206 Transcript_128021/m.410206 type:complete len:447 (-) Transcript_128021:16-1356(-)